MDKKRVKIHLKHALEQSRPDLSDILAAASVRKMEEHDYFTKQEIVEKHKYLKHFSAACVGFVIIIGIIAGWYQFGSVDSVIIIDVNPSIEITTNRQDKVLNIKALNFDADIIVKKVNHKNVKLDAAIDAIIDSMYKSGYINVGSSTILVSVQNKDTLKTSILKDRIAKDIRSYLMGTEVKPRILLQGISSDSNLENLSKEYNISSGRIILIKQITKLDNSLNIEQLAPLSLQELIQLVKDKQLNLNAIVDYEDYDDVLNDEDEEEDDDEQDDYIKTSPSLPAGSTIYPDDKKNIYKEDKDNDDEEDDREDSSIEPKPEIPLNSTSNPADIKDGNDSNSDDKDNEDSDNDSNEDDYEDEEDH